MVVAEEQEHHRHCARGAEEAGAGRQMQERVAQGTAAREEHCEEEALTVVQEAEREA